MKRAPGLLAALGRNTTSARVGDDGRVSLPVSDFPTHEEIEAMRGGGFVPDVFVDAIHRERDRYDEANERMKRLLELPEMDGTVTIPFVRDDEPTP